MKQNSHAISAIFSAQLNTIEGERIDQNTQIYGDRRRPACLIDAGHGRTLKWGASRDISSLDPYSYGDSFALGVLNHSYEGLMRYDRNLKIEPALAASYEIISPTTWRFKLREGVKFHNGADFTAEDVQASLLRATNPKSPLRGNIPAYKGSRVVDAHTIEIDVSANYPLLLNDLTTIYIFDAGWLKDNNAEAPTDVGSGTEGYATYHENGTGPFKVESRQPDAKTVFVKYDGWWDKVQHNIDRFELTPIASSATRVAALLSGDIDFTDQAPVQDLPRLEAAASQVKPAGRTFEMQLRLASVRPGCGAQVR